MSEFETRDILPFLKRFNEMGLKDRYVCDLARISPASMSRARSGSDLLSAQDFLELRNLLDDCESLAARNPLPPDWSDLRAVRTELDALRKERANPPQPLTAEESALFLKFARGTALDEIAESAHTDVPSLLIVLDDLIERCDRLKWAVKK